ncbi:MAG: bifunctional adenosylcobinamide kinase/adenosylcobinamide-phosphate guanylyltransferase [Clostridia bacterium]|nr:bifunctional adenosylcobinamide kinase/adenosylcobinamide-phosphate guanylyltransferase [Clostridia bacterium]
MILIIGSEASGKRTYAKSLGYKESDMAKAVIDDRPVIYALHELVQKDIENAPSLLDELIKKEVVICNEVGSGVIPINKEDRLGREATGRLCVQLAMRAEKVVRMVSGIPNVIKG